MTKLTIDFKFLSVRVAASIKPIPITFYRFLSFCDSVIFHWSLVAITLSTIISWLASSCWVWLVIVDVSSIRAVSPSVLALRLPCLRIIHINYWLPLSNLFGILALYVASCSHLSVFVTRLMGYRLSWGLCSFWAVGPIGFWFFRRFFVCVLGWTGRALWKNIFYAVSGLVVWYGCFPCVLGL